MALTDCKRCGSGPRARPPDCPVLADRLPRSSPGAGFVSIPGATIRQQVMAKARRQLPKQKPLERPPPVALPRRDHEPAESCNPMRQSAELTLEADNIGVSSWLFNCSLAVFGQRLWRFLRRDFHSWNEPVIRRRPRARGRRFGLVLRRAALRY